MLKLLFVCLGNICRSPAAQGIMEQKLRELGLEDKIYCDSAGTSAHHSGQKADSRMRAKAKLFGYELLSTSRKVNSADFAEFDYIFAMDYSNLKNLRELCPNSEGRMKIHLMCDFCSEYKVKEVPDPYYGEDDGFEEVIHILEDAAQGILKKLKREENIG